MKILLSLPYSFPPLVFIKLRKRKRLAVLFYLFISAEEAASPLSRSFLFFFFFFYLLRKFRVRIFGFIITSKENNLPRK